MKARIESVGVYLPPLAVSTDAMLAGCSKPVAFPLERLTGIKNRRVAEGEYARDMASKAVERCLAESAYAPEDVDLLLCCNISRIDRPGHAAMSYAPSTAFGLKGAHGLTNALAFDINNACAGMFTGIFLAQRLFETGAIRRALVVSGEYITPLATTAQKELKGFLDHKLACLTVGDSGAAVMLDATRDEAAGFSAIELYTLGKHCELCIAGPTSEPHGGIIMKTDAIRMTAAGLRQAVMHTAAVLKKHAWEPESFQHLIMHQTSRTTLQDSVREINALYKKRVLTEHNVIDNLEERGNTASTTHMVALSDGLASGRIKQGDKIVFSVTASGLTVGSALYQHAGTPALPEARAAHARLRLLSVGRARGEAEAESLALCTQAAEEALQDLDCQDFAFIVHAGVFRSDFSCEPAIAARLQGRLGVNADAGWQAEKKTFAFDVGTGAVGFLAACKLMEELLQDGGRALLVSGEHENNHAAARALSAPLNGVEDAAVAAVVAADTSGAGFQHYVFRSYPGGLDEAYGAQQDGVSYVVRKRDDSWRERYLTAAADTVRALLCEAKLTPADFQRAALPFIDEAFVDALARALELPPAIVARPPAGSVDHLTTSALFGLAGVKPGERCLIVTVGAGVEAAAAIYVA